MRIASSALELHATHHTLEVTQVKERLQVWQNAPEPAPPQAEETAAEGPDDCLTARSPTDLRLLLLRLFVEQLTGRKLRLADVAALLEGAEAEGTAQAPPPADAAARPSWGAVYEREELRYEAENTRFNATALVRTADGREVRFALELEMNREFVSRTAIHLRAGAAALTDPLVLNFDGRAAELAGGRLEFDLDLDGAAELLPVLAPGSAYLALDRNGDGHIGDGSELFGPQSGDGFADLARYDEDGNGWIDEGDSVFARLRLWWAGEDGGRLEGLRARNVGAIALASSATPFQLKQGDELLGAVRSSGLYLCEDGGAGTVQQIDLKA